MADSIIGLVGKDFVIMAADMSQTRSILMLKSDEEKMFNITNRIIIGASGEAGDRAQFCPFIEKNINLYELRTGVPLSVHGAANFVRRELHDALRKGPYMVNLLLGGVDKEGEPSLYFMDYLASMSKVDFGCQGYAGHFLLGLLDRHYKKNMSIDECVELLRQCVKELKIRFLLGNAQYLVKVSDKDGIRKLDVKL